MISPEKWEKVKLAFNDVRVLAADERYAAARTAIGDDAEAWAEMEMLLGSIDDAAAFISEPIFAAAGSYEGKRIGNYRIVHEIGRGGMGVVLLGERDGGEFEQRVAVKVLKRGIDSDEIVRRFNQERQILASLNHPNIAGLIDGGTTDDGLPYLVMEYVDGQPLMAYCQANAATVDERLWLFSDICSAVSYAHGRLIVHRDLKPSNILVTQDGTAKLLDFGIAKILGEDGASTRLTQTSSRLLTPEYASPEQIKGLEITTSSDVYSLGVILYELLTDKLPYEFTTRSAAEAFRLICEAEPISPERSAGARIDPDLKNIVLMALRKEPERRYESVEKLREDIRRYERNLPVTAQADTWKYRAAKFTRRNRAAVLAAVLIFLSLVAGIAVAGWQAALARRERDRAILQANRAEGLNLFLQSILVSPDPEQAGKDVKVVEVLAAAEQRISSEYADQPELRADALYSIGRTYSGLGLNEAAEPLLRQSLTLNLETRGVMSPNTFRTKTQLAACLSELNRDKEAIEILEQAIGEGRSIYTSDNSDMAFALTTFGESLNRAGEPEKAKPAIEESVRLYRATEGENSPALIDTILGLARIKEFSNDYAGAEADEREILRISRTLPAKYNLRTGNVLSNLGNILRINGKYDESELLLRESVERSFAVQGDSWGTAQARYYLARLLLDKGDPKNAEIEARRAVETLDKIKMKNYVTRLSTSVLGLAVTRQGRFRDGESLVQAALNDELGAQPKDERHIAVMRMALGECLLYQAKLTDAEAALIEAHDVLQRTFGDRNAYTRQAARDLVQLYEKKHEDEKANAFRPLASL